MKQTFVLVFLNLFGNLHRVSAAKILFLSYPIYSHIIGPLNVAKFLQDHGHDVLIAVPPQFQAKFKDKGVKLLIYHGLGDFPEHNMGTDIILKSYFANKSKPSIALDTAVALKSVTTKMIKDVKLLEDTEQFKPDLMIMDSAPIATMLTYIPYKLDIPFVLIGSTFIPQYARNPILPSVLPNEMFPVISYNDHMSFPQRLFNTFLDFLTFWHNPLINNALINEYLSEKPYISLQDLLPKALLWIIQQHNVLDYNPPTTPNVKRVGSLLSLNPKPLPPDFKTFMDSALDGVVIVSFGTVLRAVPLQVMNKLLRAFEQTKYKYILQGSSQQSNSDKFMFKTWIPQYDLLNHEKTKLFITHCGLNSLNEALNSGVPIIGFPVFADQPLNAEKLVGKGFGLKLDLRSFRVEELISSIEEVITNPEYTAKVNKASAILKSERVPAIQEAAFWINHVLEFGGDHLRSYAQDIPLWKYLCLDIIAFYLLIWHVIVYLLVKLLRVLFSFFVVGATQKHKKE